MTRQNQNEGRWVDLFHVEQAICKCGNPGETAYCPYDLELAGSDETITRCNCCDDCRFECAMDV